MVAIFRHQQMRQRRRCGTAAWCRHRWSRSLRDGVARTAGKFGPHVTDDLEVPRHVIQHLGDVLAQFGHPATAVRAGAGAIAGRLMHNILARQMIGQRLALRLVGASRTSVPEVLLASARAVSSAAPVSNSSSWNSSWAIWRVIRSDERPNCMRRSLAIWNRSFSISSALQLHRESPPPSTRSGRPARTRAMRQDHPAVRPWRATCPQSIRSHTRRTRIE